MLIISYLAFGAKVYVFSQTSQNFLLKIVKSLAEDINNKKEDLYPLIL